MYYRLVNTIIVATITVFLAILSLYCLSVRL